MSQSIRKKQQHLLIYISLASYLWDIVEEYSLRCDAAEHGITRAAKTKALISCAVTYAKICFSHDAAHSMQDNALLKFSKLFSKIMKYRPTTLSKVNA